MSLPLLKSLKNLNLGKQLNLLLGIIFIVGIGVSAPSVSALMNDRAQNQISSQAGILLETINAVRDYTNSEVTPHLQEKSQQQFLPQTIPSYAAREVFERVSNQKSWSDYLYKEATINPTNPDDLADRFEEKLIYNFRSETNLDNLQGFRKIGDEKLFYIARPLAITKSSCLECHSTPDKAPPSMIEIYGKDNGFGWKLGEVLTARIIYVPASKVLQSANQSTVKVMAIVIAIFTITLLTLSWWLNRYIVRPLKRMSETAEAVSKGHIDAQFEQNSQDEVGRLANAFNLMKISLEISINKLEQFSSKIRRLES